MLDDCPERNVFCLLRQKVKIVGSFTGLFTGVCSPRCSFLEEQFYEGPCWVVKEKYEVVEGNLGKLSIALNEELLLHLGSLGEHVKF